jgi:hypothetical protein
MVVIQIAASAGCPEPIVSLNVSAVAVPAPASTKAAAVTAFKTIRFMVLLSPERLETRLNVAQALRQQETALQLYLNRPGLWISVTRQLI